LAQALARLVGAGPGPGPGPKDKTIIMGMRQRNGELRAVLVPR
jgi:hypothetical protein